MTDETQRLRDPIHGLIVFDKTQKVDMLAWSLIQTSEFQRLRRIKQLGVSDFVFPGATHSRFAHSIGVYHNARKLMEVIKKSEGRNFKQERADVILTAALLHDLGHGPFSHAFEGARESLAQTRGAGPIEKHEKFTSKLILAQDGQVRELLESAYDAAFAEKVAAIFSIEDPTDIYHAVVSSSFDADRLDYLMRDRYMTGTEAGSIDYDWLIDNLDTYTIQIRQDDDEPINVPTFVFKSKGRQAAEDFLLSRYRLYTQVYLHKTTRGFEQVITALIQNLGADLDAGLSFQQIGLEATHPLVCFLQANGSSLENYRHLDDMVVWSAVERLRFSNREVLKNLAIRLWDRKRLEVLDVSAELGHDSEQLFNARTRLEEHVRSRLGKSVLIDEPPYNLYSRIGGESTKEHKKIRIRNSGATREITDFPDTVISKTLMNKTRLTRYYFLSAEDREAARKVMEGR